MFCTKCGNKLPESAKFCTSCGTALGNGFKQVLPDTETVQQEVKKGINKNILVFGGLLIIITALVYFLLIKNDNKNSLSNKESVDSVGKKDEGDIAVVDLEYYRNLFSNFHNELANNNIDRAISYYGENVMFNGKSMTPYDIRYDFEKTLLKYTPGGTKVLSFKHNYGKSFDYEIDYSLRVNESYDPVVYKKYRIKGVIEFNDSGKIIRIRDISTIQY